MVIVLEELLSYSFASLEIVIHVTLIGMASGKPAKYCQKHLYEVTLKNI